MGWCVRACGRATGGVLCWAGGCGCCEGRRPRWLAPGTTSTRARHSLSLSRKHYSRRRIARVGRGWLPLLRCPQLSAGPPAPRVPLAGRSRRRRHDLDTRNTQTRTLWVLTPD
ncbi:hypothetical protein E2C01_023262 [Portunus trituberculatus]|uniref:Uncharacterized protein n=1 Tax=Portunus trituberculatus TaxID=210409 RepID=A0A5B7E9B1_PORTR|nr:hypothetical protein [Portunus trituberculatus]